MTLKEFETKYLKVMRSCKNEEQISITQSWASNVLDRIKSGTVLNKYIYYRLIDIEAQYQKDYLKRLHGSAN